MDHITRGMSSMAINSDRMGNKKAKKKNANRRAEIDGYGAAVNVHFAKHYGGDKTKLEKWRALCEDCDVEPGPSITQCKKILRGLHINIVDLVESKKRGQKPYKFATAKELRENLATTGRIYPLNEAKKDGFLKALLIEVFRGGKR